MLDVLSQVVHPSKMCGWYLLFSSESAFSMQVLRETAGWKSSMLNSKRDVRSSSLLCFTHDLNMIPTSVFEP